MGAKRQQTLCCLLAVVHCDATIACGEQAERVQRWMDRTNVCTSDAPGSMYVLAALPLHSLWFWLPSETLWVGCAIDAWATAGFAAASLADEYEHPAPV